MSFAENMALAPKMFLTSFLMLTQSEVFGKHWIVQDAFRTHQYRLVRELEVAGITDRAAANRYLQETYLPAYNAEFTQPPREPGSAFVECRDRGTRSVHHGARMLSAQGQALTEDLSVAA